MATEEEGKTGDGDQRADKEDRQADEENQHQEKKNAGSETKASFPRAFYDPNTNEIFQHPVVGPDGITVEKTDDLDASTYYPNRALESYIEDELERTANVGSFRGTLQKWHDSMRSARLQLLEMTAIPSKVYQPLPEVLYCPISFELMHQPVIGPDGVTYEKAAIEHWLASNNVSPITRGPLRVDQLYENKAILNIIEELAEKENGSEHETHQSIRNWREVHSTRVAQSNVQERNYASNERELNRLRRNDRCSSNASTFGLMLVIVVIGAVILILLGEFFYLSILAFYCVGETVGYCDHRTAVNRAQNNGQR